MPTALYRAGVRTIKRLGRRGAFMLTTGLWEVCYGIATLHTSSPQAQQQGLTLLLTRVPLSTLGWVWLAAGIIGLVFCAVREVGRDQPGFTALVLPAALWSASYLMDWVVVGEYARGWLVAATYAGLAASIFIASGWPEPREVAYARKHR